MLQGHSAALWAVFRINPGERTHLRNPALVETWGELKERICCYAANPNLIGPARSTNHNFTPLVADKLVQWTVSDSPLAHRGVCVPAFDFAMVHGSPALVRGRMEFGANHRI